MRFFKKQPLLFLILVATICGFFIFSNPVRGFASSGENLSFPEKDTKELLHSLIKIMTEEWISLVTSGRATEQEMVVPLILRKAIRIDALRYLMIDAPLDVAGKITLNSIKIAKLVYGLDVSVIIREIEKATVKMAVNKGMDFLLQNEIRIAPGALTVKYASKNGNIQNAIFQYIVTFKPQKNKQGQVGIEIYSPKPLEPPKSVGSSTGIFGTPNALQTNLPPFIVKIKGNVQEKIGYYSWVGMPDIDISFPEKVPDLGFKPLSFFQRHMWKPLEEKIKEVKIIIGKITAVSTKITGAISSFSGNVFGDVKTYFNHTPAPIVTPEPIKGAKLLEVDKVEGARLLPLYPQMGNVTPDVIPDVVPVPVPEGSNLPEDGPRIHDYSNIIEQLDEIAEQIEILQQRALAMNKIEIEQPEKLVLGTSTVAEIIEEKIILAVAIPDTKKVSSQSIVKNTIYNPTVYSLPPPPPPKILISEIQIESENGVNDEFVELYNPNMFNVSLSGWSIQKMTKTGGVYKKNFVAENTISPKGYFLIVNSYATQNLLILAGLKHNSFKITPNNTVFLVAAKEIISTGEEDTVISKVSFSEHGNGQTIGRKYSTTTGTYQDINNSENDFEFQSPTPKAENKKLVVINVVEPEPVLVPEPEPTPTSSPMILITEVQTETSSSTKDEFVELYNPNNFDIDFTGCSLKKKTSSGAESNLVSSLSSTGTIPALGYFVITPQEKKMGNTHYSGASYSIATNNTVLLYNEYGVLGDETTPVSHTVDNSFGRKYSTTTGTYQDTGNPEDFETQIPTPGELNQQLPDITPASTSTATSTEPVATSTATSTPPAPEPEPVLTLTSTPTSTPQIDKTPPEQITDLGTQPGENPGGIILNWTVPSDNIETTSYVIKYYFEEITNQSWASSTIIASPPIPAGASTTQSFMVTGLAHNTTYHFAIKSKDASENISLISNSTSTRTLSAVLNVPENIFNFNAVEDGENPNNQLLIIENKGKPEMNWAIFENININWLLVSTTSDELLENSSTSVEIGINITGITQGKYFTVITVEAENAQNSPQYVQIHLKIEAPPNTPPVASFFYLSSGNITEGDTVAFDASASFDPNNDPLTYLWNFGDGTLATTTSETINHIFDDWGEFTVSLIVKDDKKEASNRAFVNMQINEKPPPPPPPPPPKILISEIQIKGTTSTQHDFIELFNTENQNVDISKFKIRKRASTGSESSVVMFQTTTTIPAKGYYLWANNTYADINGITPDVTRSATISKDNSIALFDINGSILDQIAWGSSTNPFIETTAFPESPGSDQSLTRKKSGSDYIDTNNNSLDFIITTSSPTNSQGETGVPVPPPPPPPPPSATTTPTSTPIVISPIPKTPIFTDNGDGTITDSITGLMWPNDGNSRGANNGSTSTQQQISFFIPQLNSGAGFAGHTDWRLPNYKELSSIIDYNKNTPTVYGSFNNIKPNKYWTSSNDTIRMGFDALYKAWHVDFATAETGITRYTEIASPAYYLLAVRGPQGQSTLQETGLASDTTGCTLGFQNHGTSTKTDLCTGLMWTNTLTGVGFSDGFGEDGVSYQRAVVIAEEIRFGYTDWRLPNIRELINIAGIASSAKYRHWAVTSNYLIPANRWHVNLRDPQGESNTATQNQSYYIRLVRGVE